MADDRGAADVVAHPARTPGARLAASRAMAAHGGSGVRCGESTRCAGVSSTHKLCARLGMCGDMGDIHDIRDIRGVRGVRGVRVVPPAKRPRRGHVPTARGTARRLSTAADRCLQERHARERAGDERRRAHARWRAGEGRRGVAAIALAIATRAHGRSAARAAQRFMPKSPASSSPASNPPRPIASPAPRTAQVSGSSATRAASPVSS